MRRRTMLMTLAGAGVGLSLPLPMKAAAESTSVSHGAPDLSKTSPPDRFLESVAAVQETLQIAESCGLDIAAARKLCVVLLDRYRTDKTKSPAMIQHCADQVLQVSKGFAAMGKYRLAGLLHDQRIQLLEFVAGQKFSAAYAKKFLASDERSGYLVPGYFDRA